MARRSVSSTPPPSASTKLEVPGLFLIEKGYAYNNLCTVQLRFENEEYQNNFVRTLQEKLENISGISGCSVSIANLNIEEGAVCSLTLEGSGDHTLLGNFLSEQFSIDEMLRSADLLSTEGEERSASDQQFFGLVGAATPMDYAFTVPSRSNDTRQNTVEIDGKEYVKVDYPGESNACLPLALILTPLLERVKNPDEFFRVAKAFFEGDETAEKRRLQMLDGIEDLFFPILGLLRTGERSEFEPTTQKFLGFLGSFVFLFNKDLGAVAEEMNPEENREIFFGEQHGENFIAAAAQQYKYYCEVYKKGENGVSNLGRGYGEESSEIKFKIFHGHYDNSNSEKTGGENHYFALVEKSNLGFSWEQRKALNETLKDLSEKTKEIYPRLEKARDEILARDLINEGFKEKFAAVVKDHWSFFPDAWEEIAEITKNSLEREIRITNLMSAAFEEIEASSSIEDKIKDEIKAYQEPGSTVKNGQIIDRLYNVCYSFVENNEQASDKSGHVYMTRTVQDKFKEEVFSCVTDNGFPLDAKNDTYPKIEEFPVDAEGKGRVIVETSQFDNKKLKVSIIGCIGDEIVRGGERDYLGTQKQLNKIVKEGIEFMKERVAAHLEKKGNSDSKQAERELTSNEEDVLSAMMNGDSKLLKDIKGFVLNGLRKGMDFDTALDEYYQRSVPEQNHEVQGGVGYSPDSFFSREAGEVREGFSNEENTQSHSSPSNSNTNR